MALWPAATYLGPPDSNWAGALIEFRGMVEHIAEGSYQGTISWQRNPISDVSSHFVIDYDGACAQMLDTTLTAWTQSNGNGHWVSAELAGFHTGSYTPAQQETLSRLYAWLHTTHGVPLQLADSPSARGWGWHGMGGAAWGNHPDCPGPTNVALRTPMLARTVDILSGGSLAPAPSPRKVDHEMFRLIDIDGGQFIIGWDALSPSGFSYVTYGDEVDPQVLILAEVIPTVDARDPKFAGRNINAWRPGAFGPAREAALEAFIARVVDALPAGGTGAGGITVAQVAAAVRGELDKTNITGTLVAGA